MGGERPKNTEGFIGEKSVKNEHNGKTTELLSSRDAGNILASVCTGLFDWVTTLIIKVRSATIKI